MKKADNLATDTPNLRDRVTLSISRHDCFGAMAKTPPAIDPPRRSG